jgi:Ni,Fe-hydrogenase I cytochrome b subunit
VYIDLFNDALVQFISHLFSIIIRNARNDIESPCTHTICMWLISVFVNGLSFKWHSDRYKDIY